MARKTQSNNGRTRITGIWIVLIFVFIAELFLYTWCRVNYIGVGYEITKETKKQQELIALQNNLKIELASLKSPERLAKIAKDQLGLIIPSKDQTIVLP